MNNYKIFTTYVSRKAVDNRKRMECKKCANNRYAAIATSSGTISNSLGYEDGEKIQFSELLYIVQRIKASINIPLSVDLERGWVFPRA